MPLTYENLIELARWIDGIEEQTVNKYWVGQIGASFVVYSPSAEIVAFRPDQESAENARDALNAQLEKESREQ